MTRCTRRSPVPGSSAGTARSEPEHESQHESGAASAIRATAAFTRVRGRALQATDLKPSLAQVFPLGVGGDDEVVLFLSAPLFDLFFSGDGGADVVGGLVVDELVDVVLLGEAGDEFFLVLVDAPPEVVGHSDVHDFVVSGG